MYLSSIPVETGTDPNRPRPGRMWVSNPYRIHQRLSMAFDHAEGERVLFRVEGPVLTSRGLRPRLLVQSHTAPDWDAAFRNAPFLVVGQDIRVKEDGRRFEAGQKLHFLLRANPTVKTNGKRRAIADPQGQVAWLQRKAEAHGFTLDDLEVRSITWQHSRHSREVDPHPQLHFGVTFTGQLTVVDSERFHAALQCGVGPAKAYGFGLLSVAPAGGM